MDEGTPEILYTQINNNNNNNNKLTKVQTNITSDM